MKKDIRSQLSGDAIPARAAENMHFDAFELAESQEQRLWCRPKIWLGPGIFFEMLAAVSCQNRYAHFNKKLNR